jgi:hypothetical protein
MSRPQKVTATSREAYHAHKALKSQRMDVARFILAETKAGRWTWISKIADNAATIGHSELSQKSSASRALNELKGIDIELDGTTYIMHMGASFVPPGCKRRVEPWAMILKK